MRDPGHTVISLLDTHLPHYGILAMTPLPVISGTNPNAECMEDIFKKRDHDADDPVDRRRTGSRDRS
jgi:hypothetical protein